MYAIITHKLTMIGTATYIQKEAAVSNRGRRSRRLPPSRKGIKFYEFVIILPNQLACRFLDLLCQFSKIQHPFPCFPPFCDGPYTIDNISDYKYISRHWPLTRQCWPKIPSWLGGRSLRKRGQINDPRPQCVRILITKEAFYVNAKLVCSSGLQNRYRLTNQCQCCHCE